MNLYKVVGSIRSFVLTEMNLDANEYEIVSDSIDDGATLAPAISQDIYDAIAELPGEFLANGFSIELI